MESDLLSVDYIVDYKAKTLDDTKLQNWGYVPNIRSWPLTP